MPEETTTAVARARAVIELNTAYFRAKAMQSAVELGVFELLAEAPATAESVRLALGVKHRLFPEFLDVLCELGLLERDGTGYRNSDLASEFLVPGAPTYLGGTAKQHANMHYHAWGKLTEALREGKATSPVAGLGPAAYPTVYQDLDKARHVMAHMDAHNGFTGDELAREIDWSRYRSFADIGGARGNVAARIALAHPHLTGEVFDLPGLAPLADELLKDLGVADRVKFTGGDFFTQLMPAVDVLILGHVLADWPTESRLDLIDRAYAALPPGGTIVVYDAMIDRADERLDTLLQRINSAIIRDDNSQYSVEDCREWLAAAGFRNERAFRTDTITRDHFVIAVKPN
ncbi:methyltransferase [Amycolatopsis orientalis]|uniref:methyltransferase n=1 Tax=Amycolatopsis orientalis TaxID=31958 RepID=UPI00040F3507|nr:methyltransferase [Amycolatopsis orientalis]